MASQTLLLLASGCVVVLLGCLFLSVGVVPSRHGLIRKENEPVTFIFMILLMVLGGVGLIGAALLPIHMPVVPAPVTGNPRQRGTVVASFLLGLVMTVVGLVRLFRGGYYGRENWPFGFGMERVWISPQEEPVRFWLSSGLLALTGLVTLLLALAVQLGMI